MSFSGFRRWSFPLRAETLETTCCPRRRRAPPRQEVLLPTPGELVDAGAFRAAPQGYVSFDHFKRELLKRAELDAAAERALGTAGLRAVTEQRLDPKEGELVTKRWVVGLEAV